jgi:hypothetical protein
MGLDGSLQFWSCTVPSENKIPNRREFLHKTAFLSGAAIASAPVPARRLASGQIVTPPIVAGCSPTFTGPISTSIASAHPIAEWAKDNCSKVASVQAGSLTAIRAIAPAYERLSASGGTSLLGEAADALSGLNSELTAWQWNTASTYEAALDSKRGLPPPSEAQLASLASLLQANGASSISTQILKQWFTASALSSGVKDLAAGGLTELFNGSVSLWRAKAASEASLRFMPVAFQVSASCLKWHDMADEAFAAAAVTQALAILVPALAPLLEPIAALDALIGGIDYGIYLLCSI